MRSGDVPYGCYKNAKGHNLIFVCMFVYRIRLTPILPSVILSFENCNNIVYPRNVQYIHTVTVDVSICINTDGHLGDCTTTGLYK
ncbi:hypothetical protein AN619_03960 [Thermotalea metallivorans]|uniref:Uncharacterized protein n=1 Tax=Thermotalea metallivorans TaxID=520762 RepID=A0A140LAU2_9FIRM|nr:hypothetical protein AN619_03960 [Thermotalea metallivorans]